MRFREIMEDKKKDIWALLVTVAVHVAALLALIFCTLAIPVIPDNDGEGVVLQLGMLDAEAGTFTPTPVVQPIPQPEPEPEPVVTQDIEETVSLDEEKPEPQEEPEQKPTPQPEPEPETTHLDNLWADAVNKGKNAADTSGVSSEKKGSPQGTATSGAVSGSPGYGDYDLGGRGLVGYLPRPEYSGTNDEGVLVVEITVDAKGNVVNAAATPQGSTGTVYTNATLRARAEAAARRAKFAIKTDGNENQIGTITYRFKQN